MRCHFPRPSCRPQFVANNRILGRQTGAHTSPQRLPHSLLWTDFAGMDWTLVLGYDFTKHIDLSLREPRSRRTCIGMDTLVCLARDNRFLPPSQRIFN
jgi:hypothetical protein